MFNILNIFFEFSKLTNRIQLRISLERLLERGIRKIVDSKFDHDSSQPWIRYDYPIRIRKNPNPRLVPSPSCPNANICTPY